MYLGLRPATFGTRSLAIDSQFTHDGRSLEHPVKIYDHSLEDHDRVPILLTTFHDRKNVSPKRMLWIFEILLTALECVGLLVVIDPVSNYLRQPRLPTLNPLGI
jgi:hypothetical protein